jgi:hypothetical protein
MGDDSVIQIDLDSGKVVRRVKTGAAPEGLAMASVP